MKSRPEGRAHRAKIRALIIPRLFVGARVPTGAFIADLLGISDGPSALRHMRRVLAEEGIATEVRGIGGDRRVYVTALPERRAAA